MPIVFAGIAPHSGNLMRGESESTPIPRTHAAMREMQRMFWDAQPDAIALITPHGHAVRGAYTLAAAPHCASVQNDVPVRADTDLNLVSQWAYHATALGVPTIPLTMQDPDAPFPLDWGAAIPLARLAPPPNTPSVAIACPSTSLTRPQLMAWGEALVLAAAALPSRIALIVSADQGHGHAADGPYGFAAESAEYDSAMQAAVHANDLPSLLTWDDDWIEAAKTDSYWQTLALIGVQKHVSLRSQILSYEVDHYFALLCAVFSP